ncbi:MAG: hypothetical protein QM715_04350 [Nibricoccus sp.]
MIARSPRRHRWLGIYLIVTCLLLGGFLLRVGYGFDRRDTTTGVGDRIVTISVFYAPGGGRDMWYVCDRGIVCSQSGRFSELEEVVYLSAQQIERLRSAVEKIPANLRGTVTEHRGVADGLYLDVAFTPDGGYRHDEISAHQVYLKELEPLFTMINGLVPEKRRINYNQVLSAKENIPGYYAAVTRMSQSDYNRRTSSFIWFLPTPVREVKVPGEEIFPPEKIKEVSDSSPTAL